MCESLKVFFVFPVFLTVNVCLPHKDHHELRGLSSSTTRGHRIHTTDTHLPRKCAVSFVISSVGDTRTSACTALNASTRPAPCCVTVCSGSPSVWLEATRCAVDSNRERATRPVCADVPWTSNSSADTPAMNGVAIDVPESTANVPSGTGNVERMLPPGAATAGLKKKSFVGPKLVKLEMSPPAASGKLKDAPVWGNETATGTPAANSLTNCWEWVSEPVYSGLRYR